MNTLAYSVKGLGNFHDSYLNVTHDVEVRQREREREREREMKTREKEKVGNENERGH